MAGTVTAVLEKGSESTFVVPKSMKELVAAINAEAQLVEQAEGSALQHSIVEGHLLIEARKRVKQDQQGFLKWLDKNYRGKTTSAYRSMSIAENFQLVENAESRWDALRIIDEHIKQQKASASVDAPRGRGRPRKVQSAPETVLLPAEGQTTPNGHDDGREEFRAETADP